MHTAGGDLLPGQDADAARMQVSDPEELRDELQALRGRHA